MPALNGIVTKAIAVVRRTEFLWLASLVVVFIAGIGVGVAAGSRSDNGEERPTPMSSATPTTTQTTTPLPTDTSQPTSTPQPPTPVSTSTRPPPSTPTTGPASSFRDGVYRVGIDIAPGTYRNSGLSGSCYWERLSGFSGELADIIANNISSAQQIVTIGGSDAGFSSTGCGTWTRISS